MQSRELTAEESGRLRNDGSRLMDKDNVLPILSTRV